MSPCYGYGRGKKPYFYYQCTKRQHQAGCAMANVPAQPLEDVIVRRLNQLSKQDRTIEHLVKETMAGTAELTQNLEYRLANLQGQRVQVQAKIDALVESIADRQKTGKSIGRRLVELEEQSEQLENEILDLDMEIDATKKKAVNANALSASLTTFNDFYQEATPEEQRELIQLRVNQLVWTPDEIRLSLLDGEEAAVTAVQRKATTGSPDVGFTEPLGVWDKFLISQGVRGNTRYIEIGRQPRRAALKVAKHRNPLKQALAYQALLDAGAVDSQTELARLCSTPRSTISAYLRLLGLDAKVQAETIALDDDDERLDTLTESQLRGLLGKRSSDQRKRLSVLLDGNTR